MDIIFFAAAHPTFVDTFIDQYVQTGQKTSIRCIATGNPTPEIRWKLDGEILEENSDIKIGSFLNPSGDVVSYVNISNVHLHYGGEYQCISSNEVGEIHHVGQMFVYGRYNFLFNCNEINLRWVFFSMNLVFLNNFLFHLFYFVAFVHMQYLFDRDCKLHYFAAFKQT